MGRMRSGVWSATSTPAENPFGPAPRRCTTPIPGSPAALSMAAASASIMGMFMTFRGGRSRVSVRTAPDRSTRRPDVVGISEGLMNHHLLDSKGTRRTTGPGRDSLLALEHRLALLVVGGDAFLRILALEELLLQLALEREAGFEGHLGARLDGALDPAHRLRGLARRDEAGRVLHDAGPPRLGRVVPQLVHEAE